jgi:predicted secreted hydrolase
VRRALRRAGALAVAVAAAALAPGAAAGSAAAAAAPPPPAAGEPRSGRLPYADVRPGPALQFPRDHGSHDAYRTEWWYVTGWLRDGRGGELGFQVTFFRTRPDVDTRNPSAFTPRQLIIGHAAISDPARGRLWKAQRIARAGLGLAEAAAGDTRVILSDWRLERAGERYVTTIRDADFGLELDLERTQPVLLNGEQGFSRKGAAELAASHYYSLPHLRVRGRVLRGGRPTAVTGEAWLDHEWSSAYLEPGAAGWDWLGLNLDDGGALMAFRIRDREGRTRWAAGTLRGADGSQRALRQDEVEFRPGRRWRSPRTGVEYPVEFDVRAGPLEFRLQPLMDDQESDTRATTGAIYWEGAVRAVGTGGGRGRGYLELTGYGAPLVLP